LASLYLLGYRRRELGENKSSCPFLSSARLETLPELSSAAKLFLWKGSSKPAVCSGKSATYSARKPDGGRFQPGISGRFPPEWVAGFALESVAVFTGIRTPAAAM